MRGVGSARTHGTAPCMSEYQMPWTRTTAPVIVGNLLANAGNVKGSTPESPTSTPESKSSGEELFDQAMRVSGSPVTGGRTTPFLPTRYQEKSGWNPLT